jgi:hypothetical protein
MDAFRGVATNLLYVNIPAASVMLASIFDQSWIVVARALYAALSKQVRA